MFETFGTLAPVFSLILVGWIMGKVDWLPDGAVTILNSYVVRLALPVLMFEFIARSDWGQLWHAGFAVSFTIGMLVAFGISLFLLDRQANLATRSINGLSGAYSNTAFLGIPICTSLFGAQGTAAAVIASLLTVGFLFAFAIILIETSLQKTESLKLLLRNLSLSLIKNPLITAPILGGIWAALQVPYPDLLYRATNLISISAPSLALVTIGLFLAQPDPKTKSGNQPLLAILAVKLGLQPLVTFAAAWWLGVPPIWAALAVLIAAMPTGTGPFMVSRLYEQNATGPAKAILISTILSLMTISVLMPLLA